LHPVVSDLRLAVRRARKRPGFTIVALLSLTLGIGANTAVFSLVNAILLRRAPIPHPEQIAEVYQRQNDFPYSSFSYPDYVDFRRATATTFSQVSISLFTMAAYDVGDHVESLMGELVNGDYFPLLGLRPAVGRLLGPSDDVAPGAHPVVVLSHDYWQRAFGGDPKVVGRLMRLAGRQYTIVGVAPATYTGTISGIVPAVFVPIMMINQIQPDVRDQLAQRGNHSGFIKARLASGATMVQARAVANRFVTDMLKQYPTNWPTGTSIAVIPMSDVAVNPLLDPVVKPAAAALMVVVGLVLLVAMAFMLFAAVALALSVLGVYGIVGYAVARRTREAGIRLAVGAQPRAIVALLMREGVTLVVVGAVLGVLLGFGSAEVLRSLLYGVGSSDPITFIAAPVILIVVGALAAFLPARRAGRVDPAGVLQAE
jgi:hypothetical protein